MSHIAGKLIKRYGATDEAHALFMKTAEKCNPPLADSELDKIWYSATKFGTKVSGQDGYIDPKVYNSDCVLKPEDFSDVGQTTVLAREYKGKLRFSPATDYMVYNGSFWEETAPKSQGISQELTERQMEEAEAEIKKAQEYHSGNGAYGYMLNSRCWSYDVGLALLVFSTSGDWDIVMEMLHRLKEDQNADGSWNFSYDIYIGKLFHDYVRTGAIGWVVWGICYAILQMGTFCDEKHGFKKMLMKAGEWILSRQITDTKDPRYGLLRGGYGAYDSEYRYSDVEIEWCSTEHQCSTLQALEGLSLVLNDKKYKEAAELVRDQLFLKCYDESNGRFYQGINGGKLKSGAGWISLDYAKRI